MNLSPKKNLEVKLMHLGETVNSSSQVMLLLEDWIEVEEKPQMCDVNGAMQEHLVSPKNAAICCNVCKETFSTEQTLSVHMRIHKETKTSRELKTKVELPDGECPQICSNSFATNGNSFPDHYKKLVEEKNNLACYVCREVFSTKIELRQHWVSHKNKPKRTRVANDSKPSHKKKAKQSVKNHFTLMIPKCVKPENKQKEENPFHCYICKASFLTQRCLMQHRRTHWPKKERVTTPVQTTKDPFLCHICSKIFTRRPRLNRHLQVHSGERPYKCHCGKDFSLREHLKSHQRIHSGEKPYICDICGKAFRHQTSRNIHRRHHIGEKPFTCFICEKSFVTKNILRYHMLSHAREKPFPCKVCDKGFSSKKALNLHFETHLELKS